jgi:hypothetical protein
MRILSKNSVTPVSLELTERMKPVHSAVVIKLWGWVRLESETFFRPLNFNIQLQSSENCRTVIWYMGTNISGENVASIFITINIFPILKLEAADSSENLAPITKYHGVKFQKTVMLMVTSNLAKFNMSKLIRVCTVQCTYNVACRSVAKQRQWNNQLYNSRC